jgi:antitoxin component of MazEF toxin-antitoxin module
MTIKSIQKVIKVGDSLAVTIPAKAVKYLDIKSGDYVYMTITKSSNAEVKAKITIQQLSDIDISKIKAAKKK